MLSEQQVIDIFGVGRTTILNWVKSSGLKAYTINGKRHYTELDTLTFACNCPFAYGHLVYDTNGDRSKGIVYWMLKESIRFDPVLNCRILDDMFRTTKAAVRWIKKGSLKGDMYNGAVGSRISEVVETLLVDPYRADLFNNARNSEHSKEIDFLYDAIYIRLRIEYLRKKRPIILQDVVELIGVSGPVLHYMERTGKLTMNRSDKVRNTISKEAVVNLLHDQPKYLANMLNAEYSQKRLDQLRKSILVAYKGRFGDYVDVSVTYNGERWRSIALK